MLHLNNTVFQWKKNENFKKGLAFKIFQSHNKPNAEVHFISKKKHLHT